MSDEWREGRLTYLHTDLMRTSLMRVSSHIKKELIWLRELTLFISVADMYPSFPYAIH